MPVEMRSKTYIKAVLMLRLPITASHHSECSAGSNGKSPLTGPCMLTGPLTKRSKETKSETAIWL